MEKKKYELCLEVLKRFHKAGILEDIVLIGSWCLYFYKNIFMHSYSPTIRTRDIDLLIPLPAKIRKKVDVPILLEDLGFIVEHALSKGYIRLGHPDLIVEFLVPERGRGSDKPFPLPKLSLNAQPLRYLDFLAENTIKLKADGLIVNMPHPAAYALHKLLISKKRSKADKAERDIEQALMLLDHLILIRSDDEILKRFRSMHKKWQAKVIMSLKSLDRMDIIEKLKQ